MPNILDSFLQGLYQIWYLPLIVILFGVIKIFILKTEKKDKQKNHIKNIEELRENKLNELKNKNQFNENRKKRQRKFYIKNEEKGIELELKAGRKFEELGYQVKYNGLEKGKFDNGIDLICTKENEKTLLIQCKNYSKEKSITHEHIKIFHSNAMKYIKENNLKETDIELKYIIPNKEVLHISAIKVFMNNYYNCKYIII